MATDIQKGAKKMGGKVTQEIRETLRNAKRYLKHGELKQIAEEVGVSDSTVTEVIAGKFLNWAVVEKIVERAEKNKKLITRAAAL
jgi:predicted XRE-type DNA-binding protein